MQITLEIPDPRFALGDCILLSEYKGTSGFHLIAQIAGVDAHINSYRGQRLGRATLKTDRAEQAYMVTVQSGSRRTDGRPVPAGELRWFDVDDVDKHASRLQRLGEIGL